MKEEENMPRRQTHIIGVGNQKGGVAKTTNTVHIATALGERGRKVLIMDCDSNAGATKHFGIPTTSFAGTFEVLLGDESPLDVALENGDSDIELPPNVSIVPGRRKLEELDTHLASRSKFRSAQFLLKTPLEALRGVYDYVIVDTGPQAPTPTVAAYMAVDWFVLSVLPESLAIDGLKEALQDIRDAQQEGNPSLRLLGVLMSGVDRRTTLAKRLTEYVEQLFIDAANKTSAKFQNTIPHSTVIPQACEQGKTVFQVAPRHRVTDAYRAVAEEIEQRLSALARPLAMEAVANG